MNFEELKDNYNQEDRNSIINKLKNYISQEKNFLSSLNHEEISNYLILLKGNSIRIFYGNSQQNLEIIIARLTIRLCEVKSEIENNRKEENVIIRSHNRIFDIINQEYIKIVINFFDEFINREFYSILQEKLLKTKFFEIYYTGRSELEEELLKNNFQPIKITFLDSAMRSLM